MQTMILTTAVEVTTLQAGVFTTVKAAITAAQAGFTLAFGWQGWLAVAWVLCMALDWITGSIAACKEGGWSSAIAREGSYHKAGMMVVVIIAAIADGVLRAVLVNLPSLSIAYTAALLPVVLVWYIFTELGSIAENATAMGAEVPSFLTKMLAAGQQMVEME